MNHIVNLSAKRAADAWGDSMPDWIRELAEACDRTSQTVTARRVGYSSAVINTVLKAAYKGDMASVEKAVRGALMAQTVDCPVVGELAANVCLRHQQRSNSTLATSSIRLRLSRMCRSGECPHSKIGGGNG